MERSSPEFAAAKVRRSDGLGRWRDQQAEVQQIIAILHKWGIHTLGQLAALDKEELRARLGPEAFRLWERANGTSTRLLKFVQLPESFEESFEFEHEIETAEPLLFMLRRFLEQLSLRLGAIYLVAKELTLRITFTNRQQYERCFKIPQPTNDVDLLFRMFQTHLENFKSEHAITAVSLEVQPSKPAKEQFGLFETTLRNPHRLSETLACLTALLGADRAGRPVLEETHKPDAFRMEPFMWEVAPIDLNRLEATSRLVLRRFRTASTSEFFSENRIAQQCGPYLASGNWWEETAWARADWDLQLDDGVLCRSYQSRDDWKIDGIYD